MLRYRTIRKLHLNDSGELPFFKPQSAEVQDKTWKVLPVPPRLQRRIVDLGDISPANTELFIKALNSPACGIQVIRQYPCQCEMFLGAKCEATITNESFLHLLSPWVYISFYPVIATVGHLTILFFNFHTFCLLGTLLDISDYLLVVLSKNSAKWLRNGDGVMVKYCVFYNC